MSTTETCTDAWDTGELGRDERSVEAASEELRAEIDDALDLQMVSLRLQKANIKDLKFIADYRGIGYQPLIRDLIGRFVRAELGVIARELAEQKKAREQIAESQQAPHPADRRRAVG